MAFSIESRVPFLDHRLVEYSLQIPENLRFSNGWSKYVLRKIINNKLPREVVWRKDKKGFITPQTEWKKQLEKKLFNYLYDNELPSFIDKNKTINFVSNNKLNTTNISEYFKFISFLIWMDIFKNNKGIV